MTIRLHPPALILILATTLFAGALFAGTVRAQEIRQIPATPEPSPILHVTDRLSSRPEALRSLEDFHARKAAGKLAPATPAPVYQVGMMTSFKVLKNLVTSPIWETRDFELKASSDIANIWVEVEELAQGHVEDSDIEALDEALLRTTPSGSINPAQGIIANNNAYFGDPPNVDGDGRVDILLYDIIEGDDSGEIFVAGYVTSSDLSTFGGGNNKDILYLDTDPAITTRPIADVLNTAAHEYQHLIHYNYDLNELTFVNEGLSEWAEVLNGYLPRSMTQLLNPALYNIGLLSWEQSASVLDDYRRAGLYTAYLAERMGATGTASITRNAARGRTGYEAVMAGEGLDFEEVLVDYHTANLLNIPAIEPRFGYNHPSYAGLAAVPLSRTDGRSTQTTPSTTFSVSPGAAQYHVWTDVQNFSLSLDTSDPTATNRSRMQVRVVREAEDGTVTYEDLDLPLSNRLFSGATKELSVQVTHVRPELTSPVSVALSASWSTELTGTILSTVYDDGEVVSGTFFSLSTGATGAVATRFDPPADSRLLEVGLSPFFLSQFSNTGIPTSAARDIELQIREVAASGAPGTVLFSRTISDPRAYASAGLPLNHFTVDLEADARAMQELPASFFIGYAETGSDVNYMVVGASEYTTENRSYISRGNGTWGALWEIQFQGGADDEFPLEGTIIPVRATFLVGGEPVANEDLDELPQRTSLAQNFPNPFNPTTSIQYALATAAPVRLVVYDVLGRPVRTLVDANQPAGTYTVAFDAASLASGLYLYTLEAGADRITRRMTLVK